MGPEGPDLSGAPEPPEELFAHMRSDEDTHAAAVSCWKAGWIMCLHSMGENMPHDPISSLAANTISQHELFESYVSAGFDPGQALHLLGLSVVAAIIKP